MTDTYPGYEIERFETNSACCSERCTVCCTVKEDDHARKKERHEKYQESEAVREAEDFRF